MEEEKLFPVTNPETLTSHTAALNALFDVYQFDAQSKWNLDGTGVFEMNVDEDGRRYFLAELVVLK